MKSGHLDGSHARSAGAISMAACAGPALGWGACSAADTLDCQQPSQRGNDGSPCHFAWQHSTHDPANSLAQRGLIAVLKSVKNHNFADLSTGALCNGLHKLMRTVTISPSHPTTTLPRG